MKELAWHVSPFGKTTDVSFPEAQHDHELPRLRPKIAQEHSICRVPELNSVKEDVFSQGPANIDVCPIVLASIFRIESKRMVSY
jgi:hypothetical protein